MDGKNRKSGKVSKTHVGKPIVKMRMKSSNPWNESKFKCIVISDSDDEVIDAVKVKAHTEVNDEEVKGNRNAQLDIYQKKPSMDINVPSKICENKDAGTLNLSDITKNTTRNKIFQIREGIESFVEKIDPTSVSSHEETNVENIPATETAVENFDDDNRYGRELERVFHERVKVNYSCTDEQNIEADLTLDNSVNDYLQNSLSSGQEIAIIPDGAMECTPKLSITKTALREDSNGRSSTVVSKDEYPEIHKEAEGKYNICMKGGSEATAKVHSTSKENDVIAKTFKTGERHHVWESLKTKQCVPSCKKIIYPVVVKDSVIRNEESSYDKVVDDAMKKTPDDPILSPLMQFQNSLEKQIKDLVTTIQDLHTVEKNAILDTITHKQQLSNKETLESMIDLLMEKRVKWEDKSSVQEETTNVPNVRNEDMSSKQPLVSSTTSQVGISKINPSADSCSKLCEIADVLSSNHCVNVNDKITKNNKSLQKKTNVNRNINLKKKNAPLISILKTPVRRRKAPVPFSEKVHVDVVVPKQTTTPLPINDCGYALLHEILKDCSSSIDLSVQSRSMTENKENVAGNACLLEDSKNDPSVNIAHRKAFEIVKNSVDVHNHDARPVVTDSNNTSKNTSLEGSCPQIFGKCKEQPISTNINSFISNLISGVPSTSKVSSINETNSYIPKKYDTPTKLSLDERLHKLRQHFINPENNWLYESKENQSGSDDTLKNAEKVLKEAQSTTKMLEKNDCFKHGEMLKYFDANPYLVEPDILRIKKNIDKKITQMTGNIEKKIHNDEKRKPLKERNYVPIKKVK